MTTYVAHQLTTYVVYQITTYVVPLFAFAFVLYPLGPGALAAVFTFVSYVFSQARSPRGGSRLMTRSVTALYILAYASLVVE